MTSGMTLKGVVVNKILYKFHGKILTQPFFLFFGDKMLLLAKSFAST